MKKKQNIKMLLVGKKFILILLIITIRLQLSAQYSSKIIEEWVIESKKDEIYSPFFQITFFDDSTNAVWISYDSAVYSFYYIRRNKLYLSYLPENVKCFKRNKNYYVLKFKRIGKNHIELFSCSKRRKNIIYIVE